jgi:hypothetical protein
MGILSSDALHLDVTRVRPTVYGISELEKDAQTGCRKVQEEVLRGILCMHEKTEYLQR